MILVDLISETDTRVRFLGAVMSTFHEVLHSACDLPAEERIQLMEALWDSVSPEDWHLPSQEWLTEIQRRSQELDEGTMTVASWSEVRKRARRKAGLDD